MILYIKIMRPYFLLFAFCFFLLALSAIGLPPSVAAQEIPGLSLPLADEPVVITSDTVTWMRAEDRLLFEGNVVVEHPRFRVEAGRAEASLATKNIIVSDGVRITGEDGSVLTADEAQLNPDSGQGWMVRARLSIPWEEQRFQFKGEKFERVDEKTYVITHGEFTWCNCEEGEPADWSISADEMRARADGDLEARGATVNLRDRPFLPLPYLRYPLATDRRSGFLPPVVASSSRNGLEIETPYYQALGRSADATLGPRWLQFRGVDLGAEFRYNLGPGAEGRVWGSGIDDSREHAGRGGVRVEHRTDIGDRLSLAADAVWLTDNEVLYDLDHREYGDEHARMLESRAYVSLHAPASMNLTTEVSVFDDLMGGDLRKSSLGLHDRDETMPQRLPAVTYTLLTRRLAGPVYFDLTAGAVNYWMEDAEAGGGQLYTAMPRLVLPARLGGAVDFWAAAGWNEWYAVPRPEYFDERTQGGAATAEVKASVEWEGFYSDPNHKYRHALRPEFLAYYWGPPPAAEDGLFAGLLPQDERALVGVRLDSRFWSRPVNKMRPADETARIELTQLYDFHAEEWRDLRVEARLGKPSDFFLEFDAYQSWEERELSRVWVRAGYDFGPAEITLGYIYDDSLVRAPLMDYEYFSDEAVTAGASWEPVDRHRLSYRAHYSLIYDRMMRQSFEYDYQARQACWGINLRVADRVRPTDPSGEHEISGSINLRLTPPTPPR